MLKTILIVDDHQANRAMLRKTLGGEYDVLEAENGRQALETLRQRHGDVSAVLADLVMPVMDGYELLEHMRGDPSLAQIPVIVATGNTESEAELRALELGANDFILKPYRPAIIRQRLQNIISLCEASALVSVLGGSARESAVRISGRQAAEQLHAILDNVQCGVTAVTLEGERVRILFANDRYYELLGYTRQQYESEVSGSVDLIHPDDRAWVTERAFEAIRAGRNMQMEYRVRRRDGATLWLRHSLSTMRFTGVEQPIQLGVMDDVTAEKLAQRQRDETAEQLRFLNDLSSGLIRDGDVESVIGDVLARVLSYFGGCRAYIFELKPGRAAAACTYETRAEGADVPEQCAREIPREVLERWMELYRRNKSFYFSLEETLAPGHEAENLLMTEQRIRSLVAAPLRQNDKLVGFLGVSDPSVKQARFEQLEALGDFLSVILARRDLNARIQSDSRNLEYLMNDTPGGFVRLRANDDGSFSVAYLNDGFRDLLGFTREEFMAANGEDATRGVHPDDLPLVKDAAARSIATGEQMSARCRLRRKDGEYVWCLLFGRSTADASGRRYLNTYLASATEREARELSFRQMLPVALSAMMRSSSDLCFVKDRDLVYVCCSLAFARMVGLEDETHVVGKTDYDLFDKAMADKFVADDRALMESGRPMVDSIEPIPSQDGETHYSSTSKYLLHDSSGQIIGLYGTGRDITENMTANARLKLFLDSPPCAIVMLELTAGSARALYFSDGFYGFSGLSREEFARRGERDPLCLLVEEDRAEMRDALEALRGGEDRLDRVYRCAGRDGIRWFNMRGVVTERHEGRTIVNAVQFDVTEQKAAEETLRVHEEEMKLAMSQMGKMICEYDPVTRTLSMPKTYADLYGMDAVLYNVPGVIQDGGIVSGDTRTSYDGLFEAILRGDRTGSADSCVRRADGKRYWEHTEFSSIFDDEGRPVKTILTIEDTTQQHQRYELEQNRPTMGEENLLIHALFNLNTGETLEYAYRDGSPVPPEERSAFVKGRDHLDELLIDDSDRERYRAINNAGSLLERFAKGETELSIEYRRRTREHGVIWTRNILHMLRDPGGSDVLLFEYCYNIEEEKMQELIYRSLATDIYDYVASIDGRTGRFTTQQKAGLGLHVLPASGEDYDAAAAALIDARILPEDRDAARGNLLLDGIRRNLAERDRFQYTCRTLDNDGATHYKKFTGYYLDRQREIIVVTREDVSSIVREEREKNEALASALDAAKSASHAKSQFLSRMSHELRTPMNAIIGLSALAAGDVNNPAAMEDAIGKIGMSARYLLSLINDILEMSRIESGRMTLNESAFDFEQFIVTINNIIYGQASLKGVDYDAVVNSFMEPMYVGDATKLQQILINVLGNAVKFTPRGGKITFAMEQLRGGSGRATLRFVVSDTGVGIDKAFLPHLFDAFSQESSSFTSASTGTGLGLAITRNLVEMMNGQINVQSVKNVGSVFTIDVQVGVPSDNQHYIEWVSSMNLSTLRALVVDDDVIVCQSTTNTLSAMGMQAEWADCGARAVERVKQARRDKQDFDTIFIDWKMPDMDGIQTTREIRKVVGHDVTIVIITAYDWHDIEAQALEAGVDMFMEKPLFQSSIVRAFEKVFSAHRDTLKPKPVTNVDLTGKRILLAEDHPLNVEVARRLLQKAGAEVVVVSNGLEALESFTTAQDNYFDAILMDIRMPVMDGLTATKNIRNLRKNGSRTIPIVAMTANAFDEDAELSLSSGMDAHIAKPIDTKVLFSTLARLMAR